MVLVTKTSSLKIPGKANNLTWTGFSQAGEATSFVVPELRWMFDGGAVPVATRPRCIFLTHTHADHVQALTQILFNTNRQQHQKTIVYVPKAAERLLRAHLQAFHEMVKDDNDDDDNEDLETLYNFELHPLCFDGDDAEVVVSAAKKGGTEYILRTIECDHRKVCMGYSFFQRRMVLKEEYRKLEGRQLGKLHRSGVQLKEKGPPEPLFCFLGDTTEKVFRRHPEILQQHSVVMVECTFWEEGDKERATKTKHMHWESLKPLIEKHPSVLFVLQHFSLRHSTLTWLDWIRDYNTQSGDFNVHPMLLQDEIESEWKKQEETNNNANTTPPDDDMPTCNCFVCQPPRVVVDDSSS